MVKPRKPSPGERLSSLLEEQGITQSELSARMGVSTGAVSRWVSGERIPSLKMAFRIERELGIPARDWLAEVSLHKKAS